MQPVWINNGYTCPDCGQWIVTGQTHYCPPKPGSTNIPIPQYSYSFQPYFVLLERIAIALEKIVEQLEKQ